MMAFSCGGQRPQLPLSLSQSYQIGHVFDHVGIDGEVGFGSRIVCHLSFLWLLAFSGEPLAMGC